MMVLLTEPEYLALKRDGSKVDVEEKVAAGKRAMAEDISRRLAEWYQHHRVHSSQEIMMQIQKLLRELTE